MQCPDQGTDLAEHVGLQPDHCQDQIHQESIAQATRGTIRQASSMQIISPCNFKSSWNCNLGQSLKKASAERQPKLVHC